MQEHHTQLAEQLKELAASYISTESNRQSLITITRASLTNTNDKITFYVSVYPEDKEGQAVGFLMRKRGECKAYLKSHARIGRIPHVEFVLDDGEKSRLRIDELLEQ